MCFLSLFFIIGERPYHCGACGQRYTQGHLLKSHIRSRHEGNMEFYNLDKKGESTRGRKSLDPKLDPASMMQQKQEKINSLVAQIERQKMSQMVGSPMASFLGANIPPYMNALRPFMASPMALGNSLLGGPRVFAIGNMQNMANNMIPIPGGLPMLGPNVPMSMESAGIKVPLKVPEVPSPISFNEQGGPKITLIDDSIPQDLTTKKSPPLKIPPSGSPSPNSLKSPNHMKSPTMKSPPSVLREMNGIPTSNGVNKMMNNGVFRHDDLDDIKHHQSTSSPMVNMDEEAVREIKEEIPPKKLMDEKKAAAIDFTLQACNGSNHKNCDHALKLRALRKNIVRMLSVLTPDLGVENTLDYDSDQVDELLHEVIYSNIEEEEGQLQQSPSGAPQHPSMSVSMSQPPVSLSQASVSSLSQAQTPQPPQPQPQQAITTWTCQTWLRDGPVAPEFTCSTVVLHIWVQSPTVRWWQCWWSWGECWEVMTILKSLPHVRGGELDVLIKEWGSVLLLRERSWFELNSVQFVIMYSQWVRQ